VLASLADMNKGGYNVAHTVAESLPFKQALRAASSPAERA